MPCDTTLKPNQTISQRATEVRAAVERLSAALASGQVKVVIGPQGAVAFQGLTAEARDGVTDACAYRRLMVSGSSLAKVAIQRAEMVAGRKIDAKAVAVGAHAHDDGKGGLTWHSHKG